MRDPKDFFRPLAVGAPEPVREILFRPSRMIHFFDPSNENMAATTTATCRPRGSTRRPSRSSEAHLEGQARTYGPDGGSTPPSEPGNGAAQEAQAEAHEREAHLDGQAWTYGRHAER
jgi:hypothetical protein